MPKQTEIKQKELQEFWEWCGLKQDSWGNVSIPNSDPHTVEFLEQQEFPPPDLNNLFRCAVPKLIPLDGSGQGGVEFRFYPDGTSCILTLQDEAGFNEEDYFLKDSHDPALALYQAIQKTRKVNNDRDK